ncbi:hypothetical protein [Parabacteroides chinchillae]|uniref:Nucleotide-diphospho-sugar transferase n=1 Tax=Parabacteroides chinchillae TaxID=871327 RepID=A0A8G2BX39_9BACT|nr:hypothetical protein [Parabacteroides chinchillae]SEF98934.1 hypothetical protein SAMN05444001_11156 [Parabacteroides chinchillae]
MYNTPILFLIFSRPDTTIRVFERIRQIKPTRLYVAADAARENNPDEIKRCEETRAIISKIDWPCELKTLYRIKNLGCKVAVSEAITWFFEQEEYGVILEDDCLPDLSFFPFCEELLVKYKDDDRIGHIGGNNFFPGIVDKGLSYDFCSISHIWGWASWRRVWKNYDVNFSYWEESKKNQLKRKSLFKSLREEIYFSSFIEDTLAGDKGINTWDVQYWFMLRTQNQLCLYPSVNLVTNIGLNSIGATHMSSKNSKLHIESMQINFPLLHPKYVLANKIIDDKTVRKNFFSYKRFMRFLVNLI